MFWTQQLVQNVLDRTFHYRVLPVQNNFDWFKIVSDKDKALFSRIQTLYNSLHLFWLQEGTWAWKNGDDWSYTKWNDSSDINNKDEDCAFIASSSKNFKNMVLPKLYFWISMYVLRWCTVIHMFCKIFRWNMAGWEMRQKDALRLHGRINLQNVFTASENIYKE